MKKNVTYRITLVEDTTHKRIGAVRFTKTGFLFALSTFVVMTFVVMYLALAFTPLRTTIPGYPDSRSKKQAIENAIRIDSLENAITRWELYSENLARVLAGDKTISLDSITKVNRTKYLKDITEEKMGSQDAAMRKKILGQ